MHYRSGSFIFDTQKFFLYYRHARENRLNYLTMIFKLTNRAKEDSMKVYYNPEEEEFAEEREMAELKRQDSEQKLTEGILYESE